MFLTDNYYHRGFMNQKIPKLYKYTSSDTAIKILKSGNVKYSSPLIFNDPFDFQSELRFGNEKDEFIKIAQNIITDIICSRKNYDINPSDEWGQSILLLKKLILEDGHCPDPVKETIDQVINDFALMGHDTFNKANENWKINLSKSRVFCLSEVNDSILMWSHYSECHTGVVFEFDIKEELDTFFSTAVPIIYKSDPPFFITVEQWIEDLIGHNKIDYKKLNREYPYFKSDVWSYEKEWRVWIILPEVEQKEYSFYSIHPQELKSIYFGCKINIEERKKIIDSALSFNKNITFYQAEKAIDKYGLNFKEFLL